MSKPWLGFLAAGLLFLAGLLEFAAQQPILGTFLVIMSFISFGVRIYINKKIRERNKNSGL
jgi:hypothetical protein